MQHTSIDSGNLMFSSSDDNAMIEKIQATHAPDGREFDVKPVLHIVEDILRRAAPTIPGTVQTTQAQLDAMDEEVLQAGINGVLEFGAYTISKISCEISCKCSGGGDVHATTVALLNTLSSYSWDAKVVIALAAFSVNYGEFWLVVQLYPSNPLAKSVAIFEQLPNILERVDTLKPKFEALSNLIMAMLDVTECIVALKELSSQYITPNMPEMQTATAHFPTAVYWTIRSIVVCASQIMGLIGMDHEYIASTTEAWDPLSLVHKVSNIHSHLVKQLNLCYQHNEKNGQNEAYQTFKRPIDTPHNDNLKSWSEAEKNRQNEAYQTFKRLIDTPHLDNKKILKAIIFDKEDLLPLFDGSTKRRVHIDILRRKDVLLFISDLDLSHEELSILDQLYQESRQHPRRPESEYEVVWLPVVDRSTPWNEVKQNQFETLQGMMPWYTVYHPSLLDPTVIRYIKEMWQFNKKPLLVVLDPQGRVVNPNAIHMMWIWGSLAFPFTSFKEEALWREETWRIEFLVDSIDPLIFNWISDGKYICLYGGEDIEWIRKFTATAQAVARAAEIPLEMLYVGKSNPKGKVRKNNTIIFGEKLSHILDELTLIWFFWVRLESMWHSKVQHGKSVENDSIMQEIMTMLSFDGSEQGWAVISNGSAEMAKAKGDTILKTLIEYDCWKDNVLYNGFVSALNYHLSVFHTPHHCNHLILPGTSGSLPERVVCAECGRSMGKFTMYRCCTD